MHNTSATFPPLEFELVESNDTTARLRIPPHSLEAESSVLGGLALGYVLRQMLEQAR